MKQKLFVHLVVLFLILLCERTVVADGGVSEKDFRSVLDEYAVFYGDAFEEKIGEVDDDDSFINILSDFKISDIIKDFNEGKIDITPREVCDYIIKLLLGEVYSASKLMALILAMSVLSSYLTGLKSGFGATSVSAAAFYVCYTVTAGIATTAFYETAVCASKAVENIALFMKMIVPAVITLLLTSGATVSAAVLEPTIISIVEIAVPVVQFGFIPIVMISTALNIVNGMSEKFKTDRMVKLLNNAVKWGLSAVLTIFVSLAGLKSIASAGADGLTVRLSKFAASNLIPMIGGILSESVETVMNCSLVIKNSVGIFGIVCILLIAVGPILKVSAILIMFRVTAAIAEPVSEAKVITCISRLADSVAVLFSILVAITVMFVIVVTILINTGNSVVMFGT